MFLLQFGSGDIVGVQAAPMLPLTQPSLATLQAQAVLQRHQALDAQYAHQTQVYPYGTCDSMAGVWRETRLSLSGSCMHVAVPFVLASAC